MSDDVQRSLIDAIEIIVGETVKSTEYTSSYIGLVKEVNGFDCMVEINGSETKCKLVEHLHTLVKVGDVVLVQDLYNTNVKKFIVSKIGGIGQ
jgi:hypothetical protein